VSKIYLRKKRGRWDKIGWGMVFTTRVFFFNLWTSVFLLTCMLITSF